MTQAVIGGLSRFTSSFGFDDLYRPTSATDPTGTYAWSYDADNNRLSQTVNGVTAAYTVDAANRLTSVGGVPVTTDANGNLLVDNTGQCYQWDARGRLTSVSRNGTSLASYTYATNGVRSSMTEGGVTTTFTLDGRMCVNEAAGGLNTPTLFGPTGPLERGGQWFTPDAGGSIATVTGSSGNAIAQNCYGVFGQVMTTNPSSGDPLQFLGGMAEPSTGLDALDSGFYEPDLGRMLSGNLAAVAQLSPGAAVGGFVHGVAGCVGHAVTGTLTSLANHLANPLSFVLDPIHAITNTVNAVRQKGAALTLLDPLTDALGQLGNFSSPEAAGNSLCNDTLAATVVLGGVETLTQGPCFPAGTPITTPHGTKPIQKIRPGDRVLSADPATGKRSCQQVVRAFVHPASVLLRIATADGRSVEATPTHPFWVKGEGFVAAGRLVKGDLLEDDRGHFVAVAKITARRGRFTVYNFEVAHTHTYFAGGFWVHNTCLTPQEIGSIARGRFTDWLDAQGISVNEPYPYPGAQAGPAAVWSGPPAADPGWDFAEISRADRVSDGVAKVQARYGQEGFAGKRGALYTYTYTGSTLDDLAIDFQFWGLVPEQPALPF